MNTQSKVWELCSSYQGIAASLHHFLEQVLKEGSWIVWQRGRGIIPSQTAVQPARLAAFRELVEIARISGTPEGIIFSSIIRDPRQRDDSLVKILELFDRFKEDGELKDSEIPLIQSASHFADYIQRNADSARLALAQMRAGPGVRVCF